MRKKADSPTCLSLHPRNLFPCKPIRKDISPASICPKSIFSNPNLKQVLYALVSSSFLLVFYKTWLWNYFCQEQRNPYKYSRIHGPQFKKFWTVHMVEYHTIIWWALAWLGVSFSVGVFTSMNKALSSSPGTVGREGGKENRARNAGKRFAAWKGNVSIIMYAEYNNEAVLMSTGRWLSGYCAFWTSMRARVQICTTQRKAREVCVVAACDPSTWGGAYKWSGDRPA